MKKKFQKITFHTLLFKQMAIFQGIYVYIYISLYSGSAETLLLM